MTPNRDEAKTMDSNGARRRASSNLFPPAELVQFIALARTLYPHPGLSEGPYERAVAAILGEAAHDSLLWHLLHDGLAELQADLGAPVSEVDSGSLRNALGLRESTPFFEALRSRVAWHLYDDREVWMFIGYPGASYDRGGYLHRGFDDLAWLPEPRIEELDPTAPANGPLPTRERSVAASRSAS
jgi:hypothetical protein